MFRIPGVVFGTQKVCVKGFVVLDQLIGDQVELVAGSANGPGAFVAQPGFEVLVVGLGVLTYPEQRVEAPVRFGYGP